MSAALVKVPYLISFVKSTTKTFEGVLPVKVNKPSVISKTVCQSSPLKFAVVIEVVPATPVLSKEPFSKPIFFMVYSVSPTLNFSPAASPLIVTVLGVVTSSTVVSLSTVTTIAPEVA